MSAAALIVALASVVACAPKPLPEAESQGAKLYVQNCGGSCHVVYRPELLTGAMWRTMVTRMDREMSRRGMKMDEQTKSEILAYLERNAGTR